MLTKEQVAQALPVTLRGAATQEFTDQINNITNDPEYSRIIRENFLSYSKVLSDGKFKTEDYLNAVAYVSYKIMGHSNQDAYFKTFPQRHATLLARGTSSKDISAYVSAYNKGKLVNLILEQTLIPHWIINQDIYQKAINTQVEIMEDPTINAVARTAAANSILTHLAKPKEAAATLKIDMGGDGSSGMNALTDLLTSLAQRQRDAIAAGVTTKEIAEQKLIDVTPVVTTDAD